MAQYRAIFKNANIAMLAAIAASALAASQAQAAPYDDWTKLSGEKVTVNNTDTLTLSKKGPQVNENAFNLVLVSGAAATLKGDNTSADPKKGPGDFQAANATITLDGTEGGGSTAAHATLGIGDSSNGNLVANVKVGSVVNKVGTITVTGSGAKATSSLSAGSITIGDDNNSGADLAKVVVEAHGKLNVTGENGLAIKKGANIDVKANGSLDATNITMTSGTVSNAGTFNAGTLNLSGGDLKTSANLKADKLNITGGTVTLSGAANTIVVGSETSTIELNGKQAKITDADKGGTVKANQFTLTDGTIAATADLIIDAKTFNANGGTITVATGDKKLTLKGDSVFSGSTVENDGSSLIIDGSATFADGTLKVDMAIS